MRKFLSERNLVVVLFIATFIVFSLAQQDTTKKQNQMNTTVEAPLANPMQSVAAVADSTNSY